MRLCDSPWQEHSIRTRTANRWGTGTLRATLPQQQRRRQRRCRASSCRGCKGTRTDNSATSRDIWGEYCLHAQVVASFLTSHPSLLFVFISFGPDLGYYRRTVESWLMLTFISTNIIDIEKFSNISSRSW